MPRFLEDAHPEARDLDTVHLDGRAAVGNVRDPQHLDGVDRLEAFGELEAQTLLAQMIVPRQRRPPAGQQIEPARDFTLSSCKNTLFGCRGMTMMSRLKIQRIAEDIYIITFYINMI